MVTLSALSPILLGTLEERPTRVGITVIVCCHNSSQLLPTTLDHLARQDVSPDVEWEVIVVDNASTDGTRTVARRCWPAGHPTSLIVVDEPRLGLAHARACGIAHARYEFLAFVDDDNWLDSRWVQAAFDVFRDKPDVGAIGSVIAPEFETSRPAWFDVVANLYATGPSPEVAGDVTTRHVPCGAGLCIRRSALTDAQRKQLTTISVGRTGSTLTAGEDCEIIYCLRLAGWRVWIEPRLRVRHFLPARRLAWGYARQLAYWSAYATAERDALVYACKPPRHGVAMIVRRLRETWAWQCLAVAVRLVAMPGAIGRAARSHVEGDAEVLRLEMLRGRLQGLVAARAWYAARSFEVRETMKHIACETGRATRNARLDGEVASA